ncbi:MAG: molybdopterin-synthase adenylyltransferase MoeB [Gemmatimonadaceae bacterium]
MSATREPLTAANQRASVGDSLPELSRDELIRYSRHLLLPEVGLDGQRKLKAARVLLVGAGGLGSPAALYLAAAGVGTLGIVDFDRVDVTNLHRQIIHGTSDIGRSKLQSATDRLREVNPFVTVEPHEVRLTAANALDLFREYDLVVDGTDNFQTRYLVNDACVLTGKPNVYGSIYRFDGQVSVFCTPDGPCYRCLYREPPPPGMVPSCAEGGVLGILPGIVGVLQATEAIKLILGIGDPLIGRLNLVDALGARQRTVKIKRDPTCPACGTRELQALIDYDAFCGIGAAPAETPILEITPRELAAKLERHDDFVLIDVRDPHEYAIARIPGARLIPLGGFGDAIPSLPQDTDIVIHCRSGARSAKAVRQLQSAGFTRVWNVAGGILRWSDDVDPTVAKY